MRAISNRRRRCPFCGRVVDVAYNVATEAFPGDNPAPVWSCGQGECPKPPAQAPAPFTTTTEAAGK